ncbi:MAG: MerR family transcriptional regulator [Polyangiaceae bacterium]
MRTFTMHELSKASGFPERSIRQYVLEGMLPRAPYRGKDTLYGANHLTALRAIAKLREEKKVHRLAALRAWFKGKSPAEIESFVTGVPLAPPAPPDSPPPPPPEPNPPAAEPSPFAGGGAGGGERWIHLPLVPGLVLLVKDGAAEVVTRLASEIRSRYGCT